MLKVPPVSNVVGIPRLHNIYECAVWGYLIKGSITITYEIQPKGPPWVTSSIMWKKWPTPTELLITSVVHCIQQLKVKRVPLGHSYHNYHIMAVHLSSLNKFHASMGRSTQSSSWECCFHSRCMECIPKSMPPSTPGHRWSILKPYLNLGPATYHIHFTVTILQVYLTPSGCTPMWLSRSISLHAIKAWYVSQVGL